MLSAELQILSGKQKGKAIRLSGNKKFLVGRGEDCQLRPNSDLISRHHCVFVVDDFSFRIKDLGSTNGTLVNNEKVKGQLVLKSGDKVKIGKLEFKVFIQEVDKAEELPPESSVNMEIEGSSGEIPTNKTTETMVEQPALEEPTMDPPALEPNQEEQQTAVFSGSETMTMPVMPQLPEGQAPPVNGHVPAELPEGLIPPEQFPQGMPQQGQYPPGAYPPPGQYPPPGYGYPPGQYPQQLPPGYPVPGQHMPQAPYPYPYPGQPYPQQGMLPPAAPAPSGYEMPIMPDPVGVEVEEDTKAVPPLKLPDPSETGAIEEEKKEKKADKKDSEPSPSDTAANILRKMSRRTPGE